MKKKATVFWLMPAEPYRELFRQLCRILARQFDAPPFEPHLTLGPASSASGVSARLLKSLDFPSIQLRVRDVAFSAQFTKTLYVRFFSDENLKRLGEKLGDASPPRPADPHLSLLYQNLPTAVKRELTKSIRLPLRSVTFDAVRLVRCAWPTETAAEVENWRTLATRSLGRV